MNPNQSPITPLKQVSQIKQKFRPPTPTFGPQQQKIISIENRKGKGVAPSITAVTNMKDETIKVQKMDDKRKHKGSFIQHFTQCSPRALKKTVKSLATVDDTLESIKKKERKRCQSLKRASTNAEHAQRRTDKVLEKYQIHRKQINSINAGKQRSQSNRRTEVIMKGSGAQNLKIRMPSQARNSMTRNAGQMALKNRTALQRITRTNNGKNPGKKILNKKMKLKFMKNAYHKGKGAHKDFLSHPRQQNTNMKFDKKRLQNKFNTKITHMRKKHKKNDQKFDKFDKIVHDVQKLVDEAQNQLRSNQ